MRLPVLSSPRTPCAAREITALLRDTASILRIRYHESTVESAAGAVEQEFSDFMVDALKLLVAAPVYQAGVDRPRQVAKQAWLLAPLDGVAAFRSGFPCFAVVLGVRDRGRTVGGYVYNPVTEDLFWSDEESEGAFYGDSRIVVRSSAGSSFGLSHDAAQRCSHALTLCSVAAGRCDYAMVRRCDWTVEEVAGYIVRRAGGRVYATGSDGVIATAGRRSKLNGGTMWVAGRE